MSLMAASSAFTETTGPFAPAQHAPTISLFGASVSLADPRMTSRLVMHGDMVYVSGCLSGIERHDRTGIPEQGVRVVYIQDSATRMLRSRSGTVDEQADKNGSSPAAPCILDDGRV